METVGVIAGWGDNQEETVGGYHCVRGVIRWRLMGLSLDEGDNQVETVWDKEVYGRKWRGGCVGYVLSIRCSKCGDHLFFEPVLLIADLGLKLQLSPSFWPPSRSHAPQKQEHQLLRIYDLHIWA